MTVAEASLLLRNCAYSIIIFLAKKIKTIPIAKKHGISRMCLFDSYARGEANDDSDVDVVTTGIKDKEVLDNIQSEGVVLYEE